MTFGVGLEGRGVQALPKPYTPQPLNPKLQFFVQAGDAQEGGAGGQVRGAGGQVKPRRGAQEGR